MKALILNGFHEGDRRWQPVTAVLRREMEERGWSCEDIHLCETNIADCAGCFGCWTKTPGICLIDDGGREVARRFIGSDLVVFLTPVTFGGYSSELKKALDRLIPLISPFFQNIRGETHHRRRYDRHPALIGIGMTESDGEEKARVFRKLLHRNVINLHNPKNAALIVTERENAGRLREKIREAMREAAP